MNQNELATKRVKAETVVKWVGGVGLVIVVGGVAVAVLTSITAIVAAGVVGLAAVNGMPVIARKFASWKYNALVQDAIENPIPNLISAYDKQVSAFNTARKGVETFNTTCLNFKDKIKGFEERNVDTTAMRSMYDNMKRALQMQTDELVTRSAELKEAKKELGEAQDYYAMALEMQSASNSMAAISNVPAVDEAIHREAINAIRTKLNNGFARMEVSMAIDYTKLPSELQNVQVEKLENISSKLNSLGSL